MKKLILSLFLLLTVVFTNAQCRIGSAYSDIYSEFETKNPSVYFTDEGQLYLSIEVITGTALYYFDSDKICTETVIFPKDDDAVNFYVESFNKHYVIMSPTSWRMYLNGAYADITLVYFQERNFIVFK
jgi:hypothetical protein